MGRLLLLFVLLPAVELALLIRVGGAIGIVRTFALIVFTGLLGAHLARQQGLEVVRKLQRETAAGQMPAGAVLDGALILVAAALLVTPGILTDAVGFSLLVPTLRDRMKQALVARLERAVAEGRVHVHSAGPPPGFGAPGPFEEPREEKVVHDLRDERER